jgi:hypothetical protein
MRRVCWVAVLAVLGCSYASGSIRYAEDPDLRTVTLYSGRPNPLGEDLGPVETSARGLGDCTKLATGALRELLANARALGATGVKDVKFRGKWHWMGRVVCRRSLGGQSVQVRGMAYRLGELE